jgi:hypothetical protein
VGSWTLLGDAGQLLLEGTWSARKQPRGWRGAWSARVSSTGQVLSGTWAADGAGLGGVATFEAMLGRAAVTRVAGTWRSGRARGNWWLSI